MKYEEDGPHPWDKAGVSRSTFYRYLKKLQKEAEMNGIEFIVDFIKERNKIKKSLSMATHQIIEARKIIRMK